MPVAIKGSGGGSVTLDAGAAAADTMLTLPNTNGTVINTAPGTAGNVLTSNGTAWASTAPASSVPTGQLIQYGSSTAPSGYLKCDGSIYTKSSYSALATVLGSLPANSAAYYVSIPFNSGQNNVFYLNGNVIWTADGSNKFYYSTDLGVTIISPTPASAPSSMMVWTGTNYVSRPTDVCGLGDNIIYGSSLSGAFTYVATTIAGRITSLVYTGTRVVVTGLGLSSYSTNNGVSWSAGGSTSGVNIQTAVYAASIIVAVGRTTGSVLAIRTSPDGGTWTTRTVPTGALGTYFNFLTYQNSLFIAVTDGGSICTSADGVTWTLTVATSPANGQVIYNSTLGFYVVFGDGNTSWYSADLITWYQFPSDTSSAPFFDSTSSVFSAIAATDGTKIWNTVGQTYVPISYTTATQFVVPDFGGNALAGARNYAGQWGSYWYIKA
jgi:hypothetical protein